ncbi:MAG TPA: serine/threonine-protein kinase [Polyangiaceae bacterium]|nr:serine/threonine-protein kinase [Polyangiaceae bacterium]
MPVVANEALPFSAAADESPRICPQCRRTFDAFGDRPPPSGALPKCPEHGLAFVALHDLTQSDNDPLLGRTVAGRFTVVGRLGRGSMGSVYRARQEAMGRDVALKIVRRERAYDPETKTRFEREARAISTLTSQHTVTAFDFGESEDGSWFLAMEMLEGETVGERLRREKRIHWIDAVRFTRDALKSLAEAHAKGIIHRDLKPDNLFLVRLPDRAGRRQEVCKVLDFGIAKWQGGDESKIDQLETQAGTVFGTPRYMSPEQAQGSPLDARSDLYSLGVLLYQMLAGRAPFVDDDAVVVMARHIKDSPPLLSHVADGFGVPAALEEIVRAALSKSPDERPQTADEMSALLKRALKRSNASTSGVQRKVGAAWRVRWTPLRLALMLLAPIGILMALFAHFSRRVGTDLPAPASVPATSITPAAAQIVPQRPLIGRQMDAHSLESSSEYPENERVDAGQSAPRQRRLARPRPAASHPALPRKGNERYGRFE